MSLQKITDELVGTLAALEFAPPTAYVYQPLEYARPACTI